MSQIRISWKLIFRNISLCDRFRFDIRLKINAADTEKQLLSVSVKEEFKHPNGKDGTMSYDRTVIVNKLKEEVPEICQVSYYLSDTDCYKCYEVLTGDVVPVPKDPVLEEKTLWGGLMQKGMHWIRA